MYCTRFNGDALYDRAISNADSASNCVPSKRTSPEPLHSRHVLRASHAGCRPQQKPSVSTEHTVTQGHKHRANSQTVAHHSVSQRGGQVKALRGNGCEDTGH